MLKAGDGIVLGALGLLAIGVVMVSSASLTLDPDRFVTFQSIFLSRQMAYAVTAALVMLIVARLPVTQWFASAGCRRALPWLGLALLLLLLSVYMPVIGKEVNGARRWLLVPGTGFSFQPSELVKWGILPILAGFLVGRGDHIGDFRRGFLPAMALIGIPAALIAHEDLGTGVLIAAGCSLMLIAGGTKLWQMAMLAPVGLAGFAAAVYTNPYRLDRLVSFVNPYADPKGDGYHMIQSLVAIANGEGFGRGLGFGLQKFDYLPEDRTDFLFAVICEELGVAGASAVVALYICILLCGLSIVRRQEELRLKLLGLGIFAIFGLQAIINLFVVTGLAPTKGIALPLLSFGGTGWIMTAASLGVLVAMDRAMAEEPIRPFASLAHDVQQTELQPG